MISDTSPIIFFAKLKSVSLLKKLYGQITITLEVKEELLTEGKSEVEIIKSALEEKTLIVKEPHRLLNIGLGKGENSAISLAYEIKGTLLIDDLRATKVAASFNINTIRTTTAIFSAVKKKLITKPEALRMINQLIEENYYIAPKYYKDILDKLK